jgi:hypothetical protein
MRAQQTVENFRKIAAASRPDSFVESASARKRITKAETELARPPR